MSIAMKVYKRIEVFAKNCLETVPCGKSLQMVRCFAMDLLVFLPKSLGYDLGNLSILDNYCNYS